MDRITRTVAIAAAVVPLALAGWLLWGGDGGSWGGTLDEAVPSLCALTAGAMAILAAKRRSGRELVGWFLVATASFAWAAGQLIRTLHEVAGAPAPSPSAADVGFLLFYPLMGAALLVFGLNSLRPTGLARVVLDGIIAAGSVFVVVWNLLWIGGEGFRAEDSAGLLRVFYPIADIALLGMVVSLVGRRWSLHGSWTVWLCAGLLLLVVADLSFLILESRGFADARLHGQSAWAAGFLLLAIAGAAGRNEPFRRLARTKAPMRPILALPYIPVVPALGVLMGLRMGGHDFDSLTFFTAFGLFVAALGRQWVTTEENLRLNRALDRARMAEAETQEKLMEAQRIAHLGSWEYDLVQQRFSLSRELYEILGLDPDRTQPTVETFRALVPEEDREGLERILRNVFSHPRPIDVDHRVVRPDGSIRWVHQRAEPQLDAERKVVKLAGVVHDITHRKDAEEARWKSLLQSQELKRLRELDRVRTDFINQAAHELRTPLTPLNAVVGLWERNHHNGTIKVSPQSLDVMRRNVARLNVLVDELLDAARIQSDRLMLNRANVDITQTLRGSVQSFQEAAQAQKKSLVLLVPDQETIYVDESRITQVVDNLLDNALKFTDPGGRIHVEMTSRSSDILISVYDDGIGLTEQQRTRLFEPFSRPHEHLHRQRSGTGLGLYLSRNIVELHGGHIWAESGGPGHGSVFSFTLPRQTVAPVQEVPQTPVLSIAATPRLETRPAE